MTIRATALLACITGVLSFVWPVWNLIERWQTLPAQNAAISAVFTFCFAVAPVFYFALWQNKAPLAIDKGLRNLSLIAAIAFGALMAIDLQGFVNAANEYVTRARAFGIGTDPDSIRFAETLAGEASNVAFVLLLVAFFRAPEPKEKQPQSSFLEIVSRIDVLVCGLWLAFMLVQTASAPYSFWKNREQIVGAHQESQLVRFMLTGPIRSALTSACIFAAPYIVCMSRRRPVAQVLVDVDRDSVADGVSGDDENRDLASDPAGHHGIDQP